MNKKLLLVVLSCPLILGRVVAADLPERGQVALTQGDLNYRTSSGNWYQFRPKDGCYMGEIAYYIRHEGGFLVKPKSWLPFVEAVTQAYCDATGDKQDEYSLLYKQFIRTIKGKGGLKLLEWDEIAQVVANKPLVSNSGSDE